MDEEAMRRLAALTAVVSVALVGVAIIILASVWKLSMRERLRLPRTERKTAFYGVTAILFPVFLVTVLGTVAGVHWPGTTGAVGTLVMMLLAAVVAVCVLAVVILRRVKSRLSQKPSRKPSQLPKLELPLACFTYLLASGLLGLSIVFSLTALFEVSTAMLDIKIWLTDSNDTIWGRWFLYDAICFFTWGVLASGVAHAFGDTDEGGCR